MKKDLRIVKTQESLRHALFTLLKEKPLENISVAELTRLANINRGTFYLHYKNVHEVFKRYIEALVEDFKIAYEEPYYKTDFEIIHIKPAMIQIFHHVKKHQDFYQIIFEERMPMMYYYLLFDTLRSFMIDSIENNLLEIDGEVNVDYLISYQTNAILGILLEWHRQQYQTPIEELNQQLIAIISLNRSFNGK